MLQCIPRSVRQLVGLKNPSLRPLYVWEVADETSDIFAENGKYGGRAYDPCFEYTVDPNPGVSEGVLDIVIMSTNGLVGQQPRSFATVKGVIEMITRLSQAWLRRLGRRR